MVQCGAAGAAAAVRGPAPHRAAEPQPKRVKICSCSLNLKNSSQAVKNLRSCNTTPPKFPAAEESAVARGIVLLESSGHIGSATSLRGLGIRIEAAGQSAEFVGGVGDEAAVRVAAGEGVEGVDGLFDVLGQGIDAELELDQIGGRPALAGVRAIFSPSISRESASTVAAIWR